MPKKSHCHGDEASSSDQEDPVDHQRAVPQELREKAWSLCSNFLQGAWAQISVDEIVCLRMRGGLSNCNYLCALPEEVANKSKEPSQVLLRIYGQKISLDTDPDSLDAAVSAQITDIVIFTLLSERQLGPLLYGVFPGGRLEEYIKSNPLVNYKACNARYRGSIARIFAKIHTLTVPVPKNGADWLFNTMDSWCESIKRVSVHDIVDDGEILLAKKLTSHDFRGELEWLRKVIPKVNSPIVFCHNDLHGGNILERQLKPGEKSMDETLVAIDYEFCGYNYRAYDIANHWIEQMYDYGNKNYPFYYKDESKFPSPESQIEFLRLYVTEATGGPRALEERNLRQRVGGHAGLSRDQLVEILLKEIHCFLAVPNILWALWSIHSTVESDIAFGHWQYATDKMEAYFKYKEELKQFLHLDRTRKKPAEAVMDPCKVSKGQVDKVF